MREQEDFATGTHIAPVSGEAATEDEASEESETTSVLVPVVVLRIVIRRLVRAQALLVLAVATIMLLIVVNALIMIIQITDITTAMETANGRVIGIILGRVTVSLNE